jgi:hypothetical protein
MPVLYRILWTAALLVIAVTTVIFSFWIILAGVILVGVYRIYLYYLARKLSRNPNRFTGNPTSGAQGNEAGPRIYTFGFGPGGFSMGSKRPNGANGPIGWNGPNSSNGQNTSQGPKGYEAGEIIDMPLEIIEEHTEHPK